MRKDVVAWVLLSILLAGIGGYGVGRASDKDETILTAQVSSADHEMQEGYFSLGEAATVMAKPGSELYRFLCRQRGRKIKLTLTEDSGPMLSRLGRDGDR